MFISNEQQREDRKGEEREGEKKTPVSLISNSRQTSIIKVTKGKMQAHCGPIGNIIKSICKQNI